MSGRNCSGVRSIVAGGSAESPRRSSARRANDLYEAARRRLLERLLECLRGDEAGLEDFPRLAKAIKDLAPPRRAPRSQRQRTALTKLANGGELSHGALRQAARDAFGLELPVDFGMERTAGRAGAQSGGPIDREPGPTTGRGDSGG